MKNPRSMLLGRVQQSCCTIKLFVDEKTFPYNYETNGIAIFDYCQQDLIVSFCLY